MRLPIKQERIFRVLAAEDNLTVSGISRKTGLAKSYVSGVAKRLRDKKIIWGTEKIHPDYHALIREWGDLKRGIFQGIKPLMIDMLIPDRIRSVTKKYAVSGPFAEMLIQGQSPGKPMVVYIGENELKKKEKNLAELGNSGKGWIWVYAYDTDIFSGAWKAKGWNVVNIPQLCADLLALGTYGDLGIKLFERWIDAGRRI